MSHLLYSSNEMYSSTELIRKSKTIFNKILNNEIDKAIIMRDGKPSFMLLDFDKYEKIMAEYDILKANISTNKDTNQNNKKLKKRKKEKLPKNIKKEDMQTKELKIIGKIDKPIKVEEIKIEERKVEIKPAHVIPPTPIYEEEIIENDKLYDVNETIIEDDNEEEVLKEKTDDAVQEGLEVLDSLDFDDKFKQEVEQRVRERKSREIIAQNTEDKKIQKEMQEKKEKEQTQNKKVQLKEYWA